MICISLLGVADVVIICTSFTSARVVAIICTSLAPKSIAVVIVCTSRTPGRLSHSTCRSQIAKKHINVLSGCCALHSQKFVSLTVYEVTGEPPSLSEGSNETLMASFPMTVSLAFKGGPGTNM